MRPKTVSAVAAILFGVAGLLPASSVTPVTFTGDGPFTFTPLSGTSLFEDQLLTFSASAPFDFVSAEYEGDLDLTLPFPSRLSNSTFELTASDGDILQGTYTIDTSTFTDASHESYAGTFTFNGGTGQFTNAAGGGSYTGTSVFTSQLTGTSILIASGSEYTAPEPATFWLGLIATTGMAFTGSMRRWTCR